MEAVQSVTTDAPSGFAWTYWRQWFQSLVPADAEWHRCCIGIPDEPESHIWVSWMAGRRRWEVREIASWFEIISGTTVIKTQRHESYPLRRVVALLRVLGALPS